MTENDRIEQLESRISELENRLSKLEKDLASRNSQVMENIESRLAERFASQQRGRGIR